MELEKIILITLRELFDSSKLLMELQWTVSGARRFFCKTRKLNLSNSIFLVELEETISGTLKELFMLVELEWTLCGTRRNYWTNFEEPNGLFVKLQWIVCGTWRFLCGFWGNVLWNSKKIICGTQKRYLGA